VVIHIRSVRHVHTSCRADLNLVCNRLFLSDHAHLADTEGVAIIMCESELVKKYKAITSGETILESFLHANLAEHLTSEIVLGTVTSLQTAMCVILSSFPFKTKL
jgi:hypothetical protein